MNNEIHVKEYTRGGTGCRATLGHCFFMAGFHQEFRFSPDCGRLFCLL